MPTPRFCILAALGIPVAAVALLVRIPLSSFVRFVGRRLYNLPTGSFGQGPAGDSDLRSGPFRARSEPGAAHRDERWSRGTRGRVEGRASAALHDEQKGVSADIGAWPHPRVQLRHHPCGPRIGLLSGHLSAAGVPAGLVHKIEKLPTEQPVRIYPNILAMRDFDLLNQKGAASRNRDPAIADARAWDRVRIVARVRRRGRLSEDGLEGLGPTGQADRPSVRAGAEPVRNHLPRCGAGRAIRSERGEQAGSRLGCVPDADARRCRVRGLRRPANGCRPRETIHSSPEGTEPGRHVIIEALHDLVAEPVETDPAAAMAYLATRWKRRALIVTFTDVDEVEAAKQLVSAFGAAIRRHLMLVVRVSDGRINECLQQRLQSIGQMYDKAAAVMLMADRREADSLLSGAGAHTIESEPQDLAGALVSFYFAVKERSLL